MSVCLGRVMVEVLWCVHAMVVESTSWSVRAPMRSVSVRVSVVAFVHAPSARPLCWPKAVRVVSEGDIPFVALGIQCRVADYEHVSSIQKVGGPPSAQCRA